MSGFLESLGVAIRSLWWRLAGGSPPVEADPRDLRTLEELRHLIMDLIARDPHTYLGYLPTEIRAVGPGTRLEQLPVDFHGILITRPGHVALENVDLLLPHLGPAFSLEALKEILRDRRNLTPTAGLPWSDVAGLLLPSLQCGEPSAALTATWGDLTVIPAIQLPEGLLLPSRQDLEAWAISPELLLHTALENLDEQYGAARPVRADPAQTGGLTIWTVSATPHMSASLALQADVVASVPIAMDQMYVAIPDRGSLLFIEKPDALEQRQALLEAVFGMWWESAQRVSPYLYTWWDGTLVRASAEELLGQTEAALYQGVVSFTYPGQAESHTLTLPVGRGY